jgi:hypothetical protein
LLHASKAREERAEEGSIFKRETAAIVGTRLGVQLGKLHEEKKRERGERNGKWGKGKIVVCTYTLRMRRLTNEHDAL